MSTLECSNNQSYDAFSGVNDIVNNPGFVDRVDAGALPKGKYYIIDRQSGGRIGWLRDAVKDLASRTERNQWFSLYRDDDVIDDHTSVNNIQRGHFRLHPEGAMGISEGCVTLISAIGFDELKKYLKSMQGSIIPGTGIKYYGVLEVK